MKKFVAMLIAMLLCVSMVSCGSNDSDNGKKEAAPPTKTEKEVEKSKQDNPKYYFKDNIAVMEDVKVEITDYKVISVGQTGNEYGNKPVIAFWYKATNFTDKDIDPITAWLAFFEAIQDNNPNSINELKVASLPDKRFMDTQTETIKKGGTVENAMAYALDDEVTPVTLVAHKGMLGEELGRQDYKITQ